MKIPEGFRAGAAEPPDRKKGRAKTMTRYESKTVENFKVGDRIRLYGFEGWVAEVDHQLRDADKDGYCTSDPQRIAMHVPCTYLRVNFDEPAKVGYQYEGGWYGGKDGVVAYGYGTETLQAGNGILA